MLYFSETVCVLTFSSSLPALDGALESAKGFESYTLLSLLPPSELQLVLLDEKPLGVLKPFASGEPLAEGSSSRNRWVLDLDGGSSNSADSVGPTLCSNRVDGGLRNELAVEGL